MRVIFKKVKKLTLDIHWFFESSSLLDLFGENK